MTFKEIRSKIDFYTAVDDNRLKIIYDKVLDTKNLGGYMAEVGVYQGGSAKLIALTDPSRILFACDTFKGLPEPTSMDLNTIHKKGDFDNTSVELLYERLHLPNVQIVEGLFPNRMQIPMINGLYSFVHIDVDLYQSTLDCLNFFYNRMTKGGIIVCDDYEWKDTPGVTIAFDKFMSDKSEKLVNTGFNSCYFIRE